MSLLKQSTARNKLVFMTSAANHIAGLAGLTLTITLSKDGGAFASISPTVTDLGNGWYNLALTVAHTDTLGDFALHITGPGADPTDLLWQVVLALPGEPVTVGVLGAGSITTATFAAGAIDSTVAPALALLDVAVSTRLAGAAYTAPDNAGISAIGAGVATILTFTDVPTSSRLATAGYTAPDNATIALINGNVDVAVSTRMATFAYTAPDNAGIAAIQTKTDQLSFSVANRVDVNVRLMNSAAVLGNGTAGDLWRG